MTAQGTGPQPVLAPGVPAARPPLGRAARWLDRTLRIVNEGPRPFYRAAVVSLAVTSVLMMGVAALVQPRGGPLPGTQRHLIALALAAFCLSGVLGMASLAAAGRFRPPGGLADGGRPGAGRWPWSAADLAGVVHRAVPRDRRG